jgi:hypothetical protein
MDTLYETFGVHKRTTFFSFIAVYVLGFVFFGLQQRRMNRRILELYPTAMQELGIGRRADSPATPQT